MNALSDPTLRHALKQLSEQWRAKADRVRVLHAKANPQASKAAVTALETCAEELDEALRGKGEGDS